MLQVLEVDGDLRRLAIRDLFEQLDILGLMIPVLHIHAIHAIHQIVLILLVRVLLVFVILVLVLCCRIIISGDMPPPRPARGSRVSRQELFDLAELFVVVDLRVCSAIIPLPMNGGGGGGLPRSWRRAARPQQVRQSPLLLLLYLFEVDAREREPENGRYGTKLM